MERVLQKITSLAVAITTLYIGLTGATYAQEANDNREPATAFYNLNAQEQSVLFRFLQGHLSVELIATKVKANDLCDYCKTKIDYKLSSPEDLPDSQSLDFLERALGIGIPLDRKNMRNCNLCILKKSFPFKDLRYALFEKLFEWCEKEWDYLIEKNPNFADMKDILRRFKIDSIESLEDLKKEYEILSNYFKRLEAFPNILYMITIYKNVANDVLKFMKEVEAYENDPAILTILFMQNLAVHKKFLEDNINGLHNIESIANNGFKIRDEQNDDVKEIKTFSEIMAEEERIVHDCQTNWQNELSERVSII